MSIYSDKNLDDPLHRIRVYDLVYARLEKYDQRNDQKTTNASRDGRHLL